MQQLLVRDLTLSFGSWTLNLFTGSFILFVGKHIFLCIFVLQGKKRKDFDHFLLFLFQIYIFSLRLFVGSKEWKPCEIASACSVPNFIYGYVGTHDLVTQRSIRLILGRFFSIRRLLLTLGKRFQAEQRTKLFKSRRRRKQTLLSLKDVVSMCHAAGTWFLSGARKIKRKTLNN